MPYELPWRKVYIWCMIIYRSTSPLYIKYSPMCLLIDALYFLNSIRVQHIYPIPYSLYSRIQLSMLIRVACTYAPLLLMGIICVHNGVSSSNCNAHLHCMSALMRCQWVPEVPWAINRLHDGNELSKIYQKVWSWSIMNVSIIIPIRWKFGFTVTLFLAIILLKILRMLRQRKII